MFSSKRKTGRPHKHVSISFPFQNPNQKHTVPNITSSSPNSSHPVVVVLKAKYNFEAKNSAEVSVHKNQYVKLLKRHGNGWLSVQSIESSSSGLVPSSYMEIAVNDTHNPITPQWLYETGASKEPLVDYVVKAKVTHALLNTKNKVWYKLDVVLTTGKEISCSKYHRDFQHLLTVLQREIILPNLSKLTECAPTVQLDFSDNAGVPRKVTQEYLSIISNLNLLLDGLLKHSEPFAKSLLTQFIMDHRSKNIIFKSRLNGPSDETILNSLDSHSTILSSAVQKNHSFSTTAPLEPINSSGTDSSSSSRSSPVMAHAPSFLRSKMIYSSYSNSNRSSEFTLQSRDTYHELEQSVQTGAKPSQLVHSDSVRTLDSITSLIQMFELSSSDDEEGNEKASRKSPHKNRSFASTKKSNSSNSSLMRNDLRPTSNDTRVSDFSNPPKSMSNKSNEPLTPTLGNSNLFGGFLVKDYNDTSPHTSPLQPKMHPDYMLPMRRKIDTKDLGW